MIRCGMLWLALCGYSEPSTDRLVEIEQVAAQIDVLVARHWEKSGLQPATIAADATFLRRVTLDLAGRVPTHAEMSAFISDAAADKRQQAIRRLMAGPEYPLYWGSVLEEAIQGRYVGDREFGNYLRDSLAAGKTWDKLFSEILTGPWESKEQQASSAFLKKRLSSIDDLTNDTSRVFFGVEVGCAKCHDHPLVEDWKQQHYYGLQSFFNRTQENKQNKGTIIEKDSGEVQFVDTSGKQHTAVRMFLSGQVVPDGKLHLDPKLQDRQKTAKAEGKTEPAAFSPRAELVQVALNQREFFSRAFVNRVWANLLGRGLVHPIEQMHSANPPAIDGLLECLASDFAGHGYNIDRLVGAIVSSRVYQLSSEWPSANQRPATEHFAVASLRPLTPLQFALSLHVAAGEPALDPADEPERRKKLYLELEGRARGLTGMLDPRRDDFQTSATEALFMSNNAAVQQTVTGAGKNLAARLSQLSDDQELIDLAVWTMLHRSADEEEQRFLKHWLETSQQDRATTCRDLVWALATSAEFRFNH